MITKEVINTLYKKYRKRPKSPDMLDIALLFDEVAAIHGITIDIDTNDIIINSIDSKSIFHRVSLDRVHAIVPFEEWVAIVLLSSIVFVNKRSTKVSIHIKPQQPTLCERISAIFGKSYTAL